MALFNLISIDWGRGAELELIGQVGKVDTA
jgi:hypothetical protein